MKVSDLMATPPRSCAPDADLAAAAMLMWQGDCGFVPVVDADQKTVGVITDRDICMALATTGCRPTERRVRDVMNRKVVSTKVGDDARKALELMESAQLHRLPVEDDAGHLCGVLAMNDIILAAQGGTASTAKLPPQRVVQALGAISRHRTGAPTPELTVLKRA